MASVLMQTIAENVKRLRVSAGMSQPELAGSAGLHKNTIQGLETHKLETVQLDTLEAIAAVLDVPVESLLLPAEPPASKEILTSLEQFLVSPLGADVSPEEKTALQRESWPWGPPTLKGWYHALERLRATKPSST